MDNNSIVFYRDWWDMVNRFKTQRQKLVILSAIFDYAFEGKEPDDMILLGLTSLIFSTIDRDKKKWQTERERRSQAGKKGAEKANLLRRLKSAKVGSAEELTSIPAVNVNDKVNENVNVNENENVNVFYNKEDMKKFESLEAEIEDFKNNRQIWLENIKKNFNLDEDLLEEMFDAFVDVCRNQGIESHDNQHEAMRHFANWLNYQRPIISIQTAKKKGVKLGYNEYFDIFGNRTYGMGTVIVPLTAPARPGETWRWNDEKKMWEPLY